jgi:hypothetical protein
MKHILLLAFIFSISLSTVYAQELSTKNKQELEQMKEKAVKEQNFHLAEQVKAELQSRKTVDELIIEKKTQLDAAVKSGDYVKADALKKEIERLEKAKAEIKTLEEQLNVAVKQERYADAQRIKQEIAVLKNASVAPATAQQTEKSKPEENTSGSGIRSKLSFLDGYKVTVGITGGGCSFKDASGNAMDVDLGPSLGYYLGISKDYNLTENIILQPGLALVGWGLQANGGDYTWNLHYLSLNGNMQYRTPFKAYAAAGLFLDYAIFGSQGYPSGDSVDAFDSGGLLRLNTGINIELGYPIKLAGEEADLFGAYRVGMNNIEADDAEAGQTTKTRMFTIGLRYAF